MGLVNAVEAIVSNLYDEFQKSYDLKCGCQHCKEDILALVFKSYTSQIHVE